RASHLRPPEQAALDQLAEHVPDQDVRLLDARRVRARRHAQAEIDQTRERPAVATGEADGLDAELPAHLDRAQYARGAAAGGDGERDVAPGAERAHLAREHLIVAVVVGDGGGRRAAGGERDGGQRPPLALEPADELRREVLRVGGAAAVAEEEKLPPRAERLGDHVDGALEGVGVLLQEDLAGARARLEQRPDGRLAGARARAGRRHAGRRMVGAGPGAVKEARAGEPRVLRGEDECATVSGRRGRNSVVECQLPKLDVAGSTPVARSREFEELAPRRYEPRGGGGSLVALGSDNGACAAAASDSGMGLRGSSEGAIRSG